ncbi:hypothetical protein EAX61_11040 [Dokdonia sinensis]|uniref:Uncharacterized protein n=1 Tax=Dokdonia sinensis TaxID=2479847 RepID=A0A3M0FY26_9FLAO|nr:hypothetical protein [Dokdonia sinensis]RMB57640.1 hypothetical protein EAX61_11040 [Dokdonia sinensis]
MYKTIFKNIANQENGTSYFTDNDISIGMGVRSPHVVYLLKIPHKEFEIIVYNTTGTQFTGEIYVVLPKQIQNNNFKIETISHWKSLFFPKSKRFKIETKNKNLEYFIQNDIGLEYLSKIADRDKFQPRITGLNEKDQYRLEMKYHLEFSDWTDPILPAIQFFRNLIDEFAQLNGNIPIKSYIKLFDESSVVNK